MMRLAVFVCTFGYVGYAPVAPGTVGSLAGLAVYWLLRAAAAPLFGAGVWSGTHAERHFGGTDPGPGVIDEVVGMLVTLWLLPATWTIAVLGFLIFRVFDVIKPWPAGRLESLHGGLGMMADDVMAAIYANLALRLLALLVPSLAMA
jgi:phosphatidylglycerophosphatase A